MSDHPIREGAEVKVIYAMQWEPRWPPVGSPERDAIQRKHETMVKGLLAGSKIRPAPAAAAGK